MRTIKDLLEVMKDNKQAFQTGLCDWAVSLYYDGIILYPEMDMLEDHISNNPPTHSYFLYYWDSGEIEPSLEWINEQIKLLSNEQ